MTAPLSPFETSDPIGNRKTFERLPGGGYAYVLVDEPLRVEVRYLRRERGQLIAEVDVQCAWKGTRTHNGSLSCADLNLSSQSARKSLANYCKERAKTNDGDFDWMGVIDAACLLTIQAEREGDDVIVLDDAPVVENRDVHIYGLTIPGDAPSMLVAHGDSMKSLLTLLVLGTLAQEGRSVLYLDWEWTADRHRARKLRLFGPQRLAGLHYLKCRAPLTIEADRIRRYCDQHQIAFLAVDSIAQACDGKLTDDDVAIRFHRALAQLPPALCAAHVPKSSIGPDAKGDAQAFGSVYFNNLCRASWTVKKQPSDVKNVVSVGLFPQKQNDGERCAPVGFQFTFSTERIDVHPVDLTTVDGLSQRLPIAARMVPLLQRHGQLTYVQLANELGEETDSVIKAVKRSTQFQRITNTPDGQHRIALVERRAS